MVGRASVVSYNTGPVQCDAGPYIIYKLLSPFQMWIISVIIILEACPGSVPLSSYPVEGLLGSGPGRDLHVAGLLPVTGGWPGGGAMLAAIDIALEYVNMQEDLLPGYTLKVIYNDSQVRSFRCCRLSPRIQLN